jgi:hypothetical protein
MHSDLYLNLEHDFFRVCGFIAASSLVANFLPNAKVLKLGPRLGWLYSCLIDCVALCAFNWRICLPSLRGHFMGFKGPRSPRR